MQAILLALDFTPLSIRTIDIVSRMSVYTLHQPAWRMESMLCISLFVRTMCSLLATDLFTAIVNKPKKAL